MFNTNSQRRRSVPTDITIQPAIRSSGKRRNTKKASKRQSSDVTEVLSPLWSESHDTTASEGSSSSAWIRSSRKSDLEQLISKRRGSLPADPSSNVGYSSKYFILLPYFTSCKFSTTVELSSVTLTFHVFHGFGSKLCFFG